MENDFYVNAINSLIPNAKFHSSSGGEKAEDNSIIEWFDERTEPTVSAIQTEMTRLETEWTANEYARDRVPAYPSVGDQLDMMMKDKRDGTTTHQTACEAVKAQFPKPE